MKKRYVVVDANVLISSMLRSKPIPNNARDRLIHGCVVLPR